MVRSYILELIKMLNVTKVLAVLIGSLHAAKLQAQDSHCSTLTPACVDVSECCLDQDGCEVDCDVLLEGQTSSRLL